MVEAIELSTLSVRVDVFRVGSVTEKSILTFFLLFRITIGLAKFKTCLRELFLLIEGDATKSIYLV